MTTNATTENSVSGREGLNVLPIPPIIVTHDGIFHLDDVLATAILLPLMTNYDENGSSINVGEKINIIRSRSCLLQDGTLAAMEVTEGREVGVPESQEYPDGELLAPGSFFALDVGGNYCPEKLQFDHHQTDAPVRDRKIIVRSDTEDSRGKEAICDCPYATSGLIWKEYGRLYIHVLAKVFKTELSHEEVEAIWTKIEEEEMIPSDLSDNGIYKAKDLVSEKEFKSSSLRSFMQLFLPIPLIDKESAESLDNSFLSAVNLVRAGLAKVASRHLSDVKSLRLVKDSVVFQEKVLVLDQFLNWKEYVVTNRPEILFVVFPSSNNSWKLMVVPERMTGRKARKDLPVKWAGLSSAELQSLTGAQTAQFCHKGLFLCSAEAKEDILKLAELAIKN